MLNQHEAQKAIKEGVARYGCQLISCEFNGDDVTIKVKGTDPLIQIGKEYSWSKNTAEHLAVRVSRFCTAYANGKAYHFSWERKLPI